MLSLESAGGGVRRSMTADGGGARRSGGGALAPGFRFHPTDEELVHYYLKRKIAGKPFHVDAIALVDLYRIEPWDLPSKSKIQTRDTEWYFFCALDKKYSNRSRTNRATGSGYWKTTGKDRPVPCRGRPAGMKKTLVFHIGRAPRGQRTNWVMHEYRLEDEFSQDGFVVCRVFQKKGPGPQNGAQYGAPFVEEEWEEDDGEPSIEQDSGFAPLSLIDNAFLTVDDELKQDWSSDIKNLLELGNVVDSPSLDLSNDDFLELNDLRPSPAPPADSPNLFLLDQQSINGNSFLEINDILGDEPKANDEVPLLLPENDSPLLDSLVSESSSPDMVDELLAYFDATENSEPAEFASFEAFDSVNHGDLRLHGGSMQNSTFTQDQGTGLINDFVSVGGQVKGRLTARLISMLGAISSPPALAAEKKPVASSSNAVAPRKEAVSPRPIDINSEVGQTCLAREKILAEDTGFVLACDGGGCELEMLGRATVEVFAFIQQNSFHLLFLSVLLLAASFKICICFYAH